MSALARVAHYLPSPYVYLRNSWPQMKHPRGLDGSVERNNSDMRLVGKPESYFRAVWPPHISTSFSSNLPMCSLRDQVSHWVSRLSGPSEARTGKQLVRTYCVKLRQLPSLLPAVSTVQGVSEWISRRGGRVTLRCSRGLSEQDASAITVQPYGILRVLGRCAVMSQYRLGEINSFTSKRSNIYASSSDGFGAMGKRDTRQTE
ncbi:hypothetical protein DAEQUDRAFT_760586 [Daedalea quercina L-15889]|uniref:Uncharacterized protein n=1 Tax=Daedalea quercina L-15889 TaxID=1314783 RepID=A0A165KJN8_9APHY|nr:hypothetical protein DAEQUDRAFT_760586 [Daedalea quercina L-15889]